MDEPGALVQEVLRKLSKYNLIVTAERTRCFQSWAAPSSLKEVQKVYRILKLFYRRVIIKDFSKTVNPLTDSIKLDRKVRCWTPEMPGAFDYLGDAFSAAPIPGVKNVVEM
ncbi:hypothetical protein E4U14_003582 [Claviceps sp. LM454 group G7]|nr:hypothetical protein E4U14_003582 [Claviceps sp. LM454 group G7]